MGTKSRVGVMHGDKCKSVSCTWDGYLGHNGRILFNHYDSAKANYLVALGNLSILRENIGEKHDFDGHWYSENRWCDFYGRDRGEEGNEFAVDHDFESFMKRVDDSSAEYYYIMKDGEWFVGDNYGSTPMSGRLVPLAEALAEHDIEQAERA
jgi:hypothetical protein